MMADHGFTIRDQLERVGVPPPFLGGKTQLPAAEVKQGRSIASVRVHVERAVGRVKNFTILKGVYLLNMARVANQIVSVCAWLTNFFPPLIPPPSDEEPPVNDDSSSDTDSDIDDIQ